MKKLMVVIAFGMLLCVQACIVGGGTGGEGLTGVVVDNEGIPLEGVTVGAYALAGGTKTVVTDGGGRFKISGLKAGAYNLAASHTVLDTAYAFFVRGIELSGNLDLGTTEMKAAGALRISVATQSGGAIVGAKCIVPASPYAAVTGENGSCLLEGMAPGVYRARVIQNGQDTIVTDSIEVVSYVTQGLSVFGLSSGPGLGGSWSPRSSGTTANLRAVAWAGDRYIVVGDEGTVLRSLTGAVWEESPTLGSECDLRGVAWTGQLAVAVGTCGDSGVIYTSPTGIGWVRRATMPHRLHAVVRKDGDSVLIVAVGDSGSVWASVDGMSWSRAQPVTGLSLASIAWVGNQFLAVGAGRLLTVMNGILITSPDGTNWSVRGDSTTVGSPAATASLVHVNWTGTQAVLSGGYSALWTSTNGVDWSVAPWGGFPLLATAWTGARFVGIGYFTSNNSGGIWTFGDGDFTNRVALPEFVYPRAIAVRPQSQLVVVGDQGTILTSP